VRPSRGVRREHRWRGEQTWPVLDLRDEPETVCVEHHRREDIGCSFRLAAIALEKSNTSGWLVRAGFGCQQARDEIPRRFFQADAGPIKRAVARSRLLVKTSAASREITPNCCGKMIHVASGNSLARMG